MLNAFPMFSNLSSAQLANISAHAAVRAVEKGEVILHEGDVADSCFVILCGQMKVYSTDCVDSSREVIFKTLSVGDFFGELPMFDQEPRSASVAAMENGRLQVLSYKSFLRVLEHSPEISRRVMSAMAERLRHADRKISALALTDITSRVSQTLLELAILSNGKKVVGAPFTQKSLASMVGASREMVNRTLQDLAHEGFIGMDGRQITILDETSLTRH
jgi:CRP/FNR family cyclic AMP-dependent transcriptional regulator